MKLQEKQLNIGDEFRFGNILSWRLSVGHIGDVQQSVGCEYKDQGSGQENKDLQIICKYIYPQGAMVDAL